MVSAAIPNSDETDALALELGSVLIRNVAPEEAPDFAAIVGEYQSAASRSSETDHPLGFGAGDLVTTMSPYVFEAARVAVVFLMAELAASAKDVTAEVVKSGTEVVAERLKSWLRALVDRKQPVSMSATQEAELLAKVRGRLEQLKAEPSTTAAVLDSIDQAIVITP